MTRREKTASSAKTAGELVEMLSKLDPKTPVAVAYPAGDYWKTTVLSFPRSVDVREATWSDYHERFRLLELSDDSDADEDVDKQLTVAVLS